jgi:hypothetical protein
MDGGMKRPVLTAVSVIVLLSGLGVSLYGYQGLTTVYGCVPPATASCNPPVPPVVVQGEYLFVLGLIMILVSLAGLWVSFKGHQPPPDTKNSQPPT